MIHLMQATATVNLAIENIRYLENTFFLESSQLNNIYDVFAVLNFQDTVLQLEEIVGPNILASNPEICLNWTAICIRAWLSWHPFLSIFILFLMKYLSPQRRSSQS